jgi:DNA-binding protein H-NS
MPSQPSPTSSDGLSLAELQHQLAALDAAIAERRVEELKVLADGFARKLAVNGFSVKEGIDALKPYVGKNLRPAPPPKTGGPA